MYIDTLYMKYRTFGIVYMYINIVYRFVFIHKKIKRSLDRLDHSLSLLCEIFADCIKLDLPPVSCAWAKMLAEDSGRYTYVYLEAIVRSGTHV